MTKLDNLAALIYFIQIDELGWPNGMPTWDELDSVDPEGPRKQNCKRWAQQALRTVREPVGAKTKAQRDTWYEMLDAILNEEDK